MSYVMKTKPFPYQAKEFEGSKDLEAWGVLWEQGCVDSETEYLTPSGWKRIDRYQGGPVAQWHPDTKEISFVEPIEYIKRPCEDMFYMKDKGRLNQMLSGEHRVPFFHDYDEDEMHVLPMRELYNVLANGGKVFLPNLFTLDLRGEGTGETESWLRLQTVIVLKGYNVDPVKKREGILYVDAKGDRSARFKRLIQEANANRLIGMKPTRRGDRYQIQPLVTEFDAKWWTKINNAERDIILDEAEWWASTKYRGVYTLKESNADFIQFMMASKGLHAQKQVGRRGGYSVRNSTTTHQRLTILNVGQVTSTDGFKYCFEVPTKFLLLRRGGVIFPTGNTGKSKVIIDEFCHNLYTGLLDAMVVIAPPGVERNWVTDELPFHMPDEIRNSAMIRFFQTKRASTKWHQKEMADLVAYQGCSILTMSYEAFMTKRGKNLHWQMMKSRKCLAVLDEAQKIKNPDANRSKSVVASGDYAVMRRIATGTLGAEGPMDCYSPIHFLDKKFWASHGLGSFPTFKNFFGEWETRKTPIQGRLNRDGSQKMAYFKVCTEYKNLEKLESLLRLISSRVTKDVLGLPPKLYSKLYFDMNPEQERAYKELTEDYTTEVGDVVIDAEMAMTRLLRLQQVTCGYLHEAADEPKILIGKENPRLEALLNYCEDLTHPCIIWARFVSDIDQIMSRLGDKAVRYDGKVNPDEAQQAKEDFQAGKVPFFVGNPQKGATGLTLTIAKTVIYYSNSFKLEDRMQSEDRAHRIGTDGPVNYIDIVAPGTVDDRIVGALRGKYDIFHKINGDQLKEWI